MTVFVSYSSRDSEKVRSLVEDIRRGFEEVWMDEHLTGGDAWWSAILAQIRACTVFVFALSDNSLRSKPCQMEAHYAAALGLPILPVQLGDVETFRLDPIFNMQSLDYRNPTPATGIALLRGLQGMAAERGELPDPLPPPPPIPYEYLQKLGNPIAGSEPMSPQNQAAVLGQLRQAIRDEDDEGVHTDVLRLLGALRRRSDVTHATVEEIDMIVALDAESHPDPHTATEKIATSTAPPKFRRFRQRRWLAGAAAALLGAIAVIVGLWWAVGSDPSAINLAGADDHGFKDIPNARCDGEDRAAFVMHTTQSWVVICRSGGRLYYKGVADSNLNSIQLHEVVQSSSTRSGVEYVVTNRGPAPGDPSATYVINQDGMRVFLEGEEPWFEPVVEYAPH